jgi:sterol desaturase/sphingolipid hydroxylase (fatty acid hydroxylase superfamily)
MASGTSTKVSGPVQYPSWWTFFRHVLWHFRGAFLAACVCVFMTCSEYGLPLVLKTARASSAFQYIVTQSAPAMVLNEKVFSGRTDGKTLEDAAIFVAVTVLIHATLYFGLNGFFYMCDSTGFLSQYKLPRTPRMKLQTGIVRKTITEAIVNQFVTGPVALFVVYMYLADFRSLFAAPGSDAMVPRPALLDVMYHLAMASLCNEVLFYCAHRAFHEVPGMYVRFHKQHHKYVGTIGFAAEYAHPIEQLLANQIPTAFYVIFCSREVGQAVFFTWLVWRLWETFEAHSGYSFTGSWPSKLGFTYGERARFHDWHHSDNRGCYGVYWLDYLFGTMDSYAQLEARGGHHAKALAATSPVADEAKVE